MNAPESVAKYETPYFAGLGKECLTKFAYETATGGGNEYKE